MFRFAPEMIFEAAGFWNKLCLRNGETRRAFTLFQSSPAKRRLQNDQTRPGAFAKATVGSEFQIPADRHNDPDDRHSVFSRHGHRRYFVQNNAGQYTLRSSDFFSKLAKLTESSAMIRTAIISVAASFVLFGVWAANLVSYHSAPDLNPLAPLSAPAEWK
jgi:hypothetical protein